MLFVQKSQIQLINSIPKCDDAMIRISNILKLIPDTKITQRLKDAKGKRFSI